jgi:hypothetical protein
MASNLEFGCCHRCSCIIIIIIIKATIQAHRLIWLKLLIRIEDPAKALLEMFLNLKGMINL